MHDSPLCPLHTVHDRCTPNPDKHAPCTRMAVLHRLEEDNVIMYRDGAIHRI